VLAVQNRNLSYGDHRNSEISAKHAEKREHGRMTFSRAAAQARVLILEVLRSAPRMIDQKPYPRLNS
jgi:hypothetical protein